MNENKISNWLKSLSSEKVVVFDARRLVSHGEEPFDAIMGAVKSLGQDQVLMLITPFRPAPMIQLLAGIGFHSAEEEMGAEHWQTWFFRKNGNKL